MRRVILVKFVWLSRCKQSTGLFAYRSPSRPVISTILKQGTSCRVFFAFEKLQLVLCGVLYWLSSYDSLAKNSALHCFCLPMVGTLAFEPRYLLLDCIMKYGQSKMDCPYFIGGDNGARTRDLLTASQALSQLSYTPK